MAAVHVGYSTFERKTTPLTIFGSRENDTLYAQSNLSNGDSGGPVWIQHEGRHRVAGIASTHALFGSTEFASLTAGVLQRINAGTGLKLECAVK